jgi:hypothetical protein
MKLFGTASLREGWKPPTDTAGLTGMQRQYVEGLGGKPAQAHLSASGEFMNRPSSGDAWKGSKEYAGYQKALGDYKRSQEGTPAPKALAQPSRTRQATPPAREAAVPTGGAGEQEYSRKQRRGFSMARLAKKGYKWDEKSGGFVGSSGWRKGRRLDDIMDKLQARRRRRRATQLAQG